MTENNQDFQNKLCAIAPFKNIQSPPSSPKVKSRGSETFQNIDERFPLFKIPEPSYFLEEIKSLRKTTSEQAVLPEVPPIIQSNKKTFTAISSTIDILFSKIEKIKEQFSFALTRPHSQTQLNHDKYSFSTEMLSQKRIQVDFDNNKENQSVFDLQKSKPYQQKQEKVRQSLNKGVLLQNINSQLRNSTNQGETQTAIILLTKQQDSMHSGNLFSNWAENDTPKLNIRDFQLGKCIGSGKFGDVYISMHKATGFFCAIKKIFKSTIKEYQMEDQFTSQLRIHYKLNHPNIVKLYSHFQDQYHVFLLLQLAPQKSLIDCLKMNQEDTASTIEQVTNSLIYLHQQGIIHRDIKPQNIVLTFDVPKLCDFGWATFIGNQMHDTFCGTLDYVSPQMKDVGLYDQSVDIWSLGVLTFQLLAGFPPFKQQITNWKLLGSKRKMKWSWEVLFPPEIDGLAKLFIQSILKPEPLLRLTLQECMNTPFLRQQNRKQVPLQLVSQFSGIIQQLV